MRYNLDNCLDLLALPQEWQADLFEGKYAMNLNRLKLVAFWCVALVPYVIVAEFVSYLLIVESCPSRLRTRLGRGTIEAHPVALNKPRTHNAVVLQCAGGVGPSESIDEQRHLMFHSVLGWDYPPGLIYKDVDGVTYGLGPDGARRTCTAFKSTPITTYGDSFTYCANVQDEQTWQTYLGRKLKANVLNFGVGGYGTDQAYLKYQLNPSRMAKIVMLCILPENANRGVNIFRPFYTHEGSWGLTKPMFKETAEGFKLIPNSLNNVLEVTRLEDPDFLKRLGEMDYWYLLDQRMPAIKFPYLLSLYRWRETVFDQVGKPFLKFIHLPCGNSRGWNLIEQPEVLSVMCNITDLFVATARSRGAVPVIVIMPHKDYVRKVIEVGSGGTDGLVNYLKRKAYPHIDAIRAVAEMKPTRSQLDNWYHDHATAQGNMVLADIIFNYLTRYYSHLLEPEEDRSVAGLHDDQDVVRY